MEPGAKRQRNERRAEAIALVRQNLHKLVAFVTEPSDDAAFAAVRAQGNSLAKVLGVREDDFGQGSSKNTTRTLMGICWRRRARRAWSASRPR